MRRVPQTTHLLRVVSSVEVVPGNAALRAGHVPADDEVRAPEVLADHHVLHRLFRRGGQGVCQPSVCVVCSGGWKSMSRKTTNSQSKTTRDAVDHEASYAARTLAALHFIAGLLHPPLHSIVHPSAQEKQANKKKCEKPGEPTEDQLIYFRCHVYSRCPPCRASKKTPGIVGEQQLVYKEKPPRNRSRNRVINFCHCKVPHQKIMAQNADQAKIKEEKNNCCFGPNPLKVPVK